MFEAYHDTVQAIRFEHPDVTVVHATVPLTTVESAFRSGAMQFVGRPTRREAAIARHHYNELLRSEFVDFEPIFDLAKVEATQPDGTLAGFSAGGSTIETLAQHNTADGPAHGVGWLGDHFRRAGFTPEVFRLKRPLDPGCVRGLMDLFRDHHLDAVHSHEFTMAVYGAAATRLLNLPHVITMHGGLRVTKALRRRIALRWALRQSAHTAVVSTATQHQFATELGVRESLFTVVPNGVP